MSDSECTHPLKTAGQHGAMGTSFALNSLNLPDKISFCAMGGYGIKRMISPPQERSSTQ